MFRDREEAARLLAERLSAYRGQNPLVLAIPRGGVPMGRILADALQGELDVVLVHKLGAPANPEFAIGAVDETGHFELAEYTPGLGIADTYVEREVASQLERLRERRARYTPVRPPIDPSGRTVIVVDDGVATGATLGVALDALRQRNPGRLIVAVGVAPPDAVARLQAKADEVVVLQTPDPFYAVGWFFADFPQVSDEEVIDLLGAKRERQGQRNDSARRERHE